MFSYIVGTRVCVRACMRVCVCVIHEASQVLPDKEGPYLLCVCFLYVLVVVVCIVCVWWCVCACAWCVCACACGLSVCVPRHESNNTNLNVVTGPMVLASGPVALHARTSVNVSIRT